MSFFMYSPKLSILCASKTGETLHKWIINVISNFVWSNAFDCVIDFQNISMLRCKHDSCHDRNYMRIPQTVIQSVDSFLRCCVRLSLLFRFKRILIEWYWKIKWIKKCVFATHTLRNDANWSVRRNMDLQYMYNIILVQFFFSCVVGSLMESWKHFIVTSILRNALCSLVDIERIHQRIYEQQIMLQTTFK